MAETEYDDIDEDECPICGAEMGRSSVCPSCGFDEDEEEDIN